MTKPTTHPGRDRELDRELDRSSGHEPLLGVRAALILTLALAAGAVTGVLTEWAGASTPAAVLTALTAAGGAIRLLNDIIARR